MALRNRSVFRKKIATDLAAVLVGSGLPAAAVENHRVYRIRANPLVFVTSASTSDNTTDQYSEDTHFDYDVHIVALYSDLADWNEDDAEDAMDDIELIIRTYVRDNRFLSGYWAHLEYNGPTQGADIDFPIEGVFYRHEIIRLRARAEGNG